MERDPLKQFRPRGQQPQSSQPAPRLSEAQVNPVSQSPGPEDELAPSPRQFDPKTGREVYEAFRVSLRKRDRLELRFTMQAWLFPRYFDLRDMSANGYHGTEIVLIFPVYDILIAGRNLQSVLYALKESRAVFIQDYHPEAFAPIDDESVPFIESMTVRVKTGRPTDEKSSQSKGGDVH